MRKSEKGKLGHDKTFCGLIAGRERFHFTEKDEIKMTIQIIFALFFSKNKNPSSHPPVSTLLFNHHQYSPINFSEPVGLIESTFQ
jgi:hypothetical protein